MFSSIALADEPAASAVNSGEPSPYASMAPLLLIVVVFYFLLIRPQQKKIRDHETMVKSLRRGDKVVTGGGMIGIIHKIDGDDILVLEIADEVRVRVLRDTISHVLSKPVAGDNDNKADNAA